MPNLVVVLTSLLYSSELHSIISENEHNVNRLRVELDWVPICTSWYCSKQRLLSASTMSSSTNHGAQNGQTGSKLGTYEPDQKAPAFTDSEQLLRRRSAAIEELYRAYKVWGRSLLHSGRVVEVLFWK